MRWTCSITGASALFCVYGEQRNSTKFVPPGSTAALSASTNRDLPIPGSPLSSTTCPAPSFTRAQRSCNNPYSWSRPMSGVSLCDYYFKAAVRLAPFDDTVQCQRYCHAFHSGCPHSSASNIPSTRPIRRHTNDYFIRLRGPLDTGREVRRLAQGQYLALLTTTDLADYD